MIPLIISFVEGFLLHRFERVTREFPPGWDVSSNYGIGIIGGIVPFSLWFFHLWNGSPPKEKSKAFGVALAALILGYVCEGLGVVAARVVDKE